jgi:hypothetical protein
MEMDVRRNPGLLKLDLYCRGMRMDDPSLVEEHGGRKILRTRAGLGSGLEAILPGGLWTNIPVVEEFSKRSPYTLRYRDERFWIDREGDGPVAEILLSPQPKWYGQKTRSGKPMTRVGSLQGTYLGIYPAKVCDYWVEKPDRVNCKFCSVGLNLGVDDATVAALIQDFVTRNLGRLLTKFERHRDTIDSWQTIACDDADVVIVAIGISARAAMRAVETCRARGVRAGLFRPITLWPFPEKALLGAVATARAVLVPEMNAGQLSLEVERILGGRKVDAIHRFNGEPITPAEIAERAETLAKGKR